jgi:hypothetical protein
LEPFGGYDFKDECDKRRADQATGGHFMSEEIPKANPPLTTKERSAVAKLTDTDMRVIDAAILANSSHDWHKVARVVTFTDDAINSRRPDLSYLFYTLCLAQLVEERRLESQGNLEYIRFIQ